MDVLAAMCEMTSKQQRDGDGETSEETEMLTSKDVDFPSSSSKDAELDEPSAGGDNDLDGDVEEGEGNDEDPVMSMEEDGEEPEVGEGNNLDEAGGTGMNENEENQTEEVDIADQENGDDAGDDDGLYPTDDVAEMEGDEVDPHDDEPSGKDEASHSSTQVAAEANLSTSSSSGKMDVTTDALPPQPPDEPSSELVASSIDIPIAPILPVLLPSLRGKLMSDGTLNICRGVWAMNDAAHENPDQCSDFEFKLVKAVDLAAGFPFTGKYTGWFLLKQPPPTKPLKIDDRDMTITFINNGDGSYKVEGRGSNKFGKFNLRGTLGEDHMMQIYREYQPKALPSPRKRTASVAGLTTEGGGESTAVVQPTLKKAAIVAPPRDTAIKRERKPSMAISDPSAITQFTHPPKAKANAAAAAAAAATHAHAASSSAAAAAAAAKQDNGRSQRPPPHVQKCHDLLKEMSKFPQGAYFIEPVDYVKLNIPDYPNIIKHPMDFRTIKTNLDKNVYPNAEAFAQHVRLVFQNAIMYNQGREHPVHIAANILSSRFEERLRQMLVSLNRGTYPSEEPAPQMVKVQRQSSGGSHAAGSSGAGRKSMSQAASSHSKGGGKFKSASGAGRPKSMGHIGGHAPRLPPGIGGGSTFVPPPVVDGSAEVFFAMKRQMDEMANELKTLRTKVMQTEVISSLESQREASHHPLTLVEKKALVKDVQKLISVPEHLNEVIRILSENGIDTTTEVDFESMPTHVQRILQAFVAENNSKQKSMASSAVSKKQPAAKGKKSGGGNVGRHAKAAPAAAAASASATASATSSSYGYNQALTESMAVGVDSLTHLNNMEADGDVLLFPTEDFDELRADAAANAGPEDDEDHQGVQFPENDEE